MRLPQHYKNLTLKQKKTVVINLISQFWDKKIQWITSNLWNPQVEFLFKYFFTDSKEEREKLWINAQKKYEETLREMEHIVKKMQMLNLQHKEFLASQRDIEEFSKNLKNSKM